MTLHTFHCVSSPRRATIVSRVGAPEGKIRTKWLNKIEWIPPEIREKIAANLPINRVEIYEYAYGFDFESARITRTYAIHMTQTHIHTRAHVPLATHRYAHRTRALVNIRSHVFFHALLLPPISSSGNHSLYDNAFNYRFMSTVRTYNTHTQTYRERDFSYTF